MTTDAIASASRGALVWSLAAVAVLSLGVNVLLGFRLGRGQSESLPCAPSWNDRDGQRPIGQKSYREIAPPLPAVEVPGLDGLDHKPLLLVYERGGFGDATSLPLLALYEDGLVVLSRRFVTMEPAGSRMAFSGHIAAEEGQRFVRERVAARFADVPARVDLQWRSYDGPWVEVYLRDGVDWFHARVENLDTRCGTQQDKCRAPEEVLRIYGWALRLDLPDAARWKGEELPSAGYIEQVKRAIQRASEEASARRPEPQGKDRSQ